MNPVIEGRLDVAQGPEAAEAMPISTSSLPTCVTTGPPESPEQIPVVSVCWAVKLPGQDGNGVNRWSIELGVNEAPPVGEVLP
jgi:hypothetical protein